MEDELCRSIYIVRHMPTSRFVDFFSNYSHFSTHTDDAIHLDIVPLHVFVIGRIDHYLWHQRESGAANSSITFDTVIEMLF